MMLLPFISASSLPALWVVKIGVLLPLALACIVLVVVIPAAARRGILNVPVYALMLFGTGFLAFITGKLAGAETVRGTTLGVVVSLIFFLLVAAAIGCFFGMFFYRQPQGESDPNINGTERAPSLPALDEDRN